MQDVLNIGGKQITSRLIIGSGKYPSNAVLNKAVEQSQAEIVTVALRRVNLDSKEDNVLNFIPKNKILMPNTSGAKTADEAVRIARLCRAAGYGDWIKIEVVNDAKYLLPDNEETVKATEILAKEGFYVFPYMYPDVISARKLKAAGACSIMPLGAPIGTNKGLLTKEFVRMIINEIDLPVIVDAGLGRPSDAAVCMEIGCAAVMVNTAIASSPDPVEMAKAFALAVEAGRKAYLADFGAVSEQAKASSPLTGFLN
jgi:thiazole synthase